MVEIQFSWATAAWKALLKTLTPNVAAIVAFLVSNPAILQKLLGHWGEISVMEIILYGMNLFLNWQKNKDLGK